MYLASLPNSVVVIVLTLTHNIISTGVWGWYITFRIICFTQQIILNDPEHLKQFSSHGLINALSQHCLKRPGEAPENWSHNSWRPGWDSNPVLHKYKCKALLLYSLTHVPLPCPHVLPEFPNCLCSHSLQMLVVLPFASDQCFGLVENIQKGMKQIQW